MIQGQGRRSKAHHARAAIERLYIIMRHLFIRGGYKPLGVSGNSLIKSLLTLNPEIYGSVADEEKVELEGLLYVMDRLPKGIEECSQINLISREGLENSGFEVVSPSKRRRNCYRTDVDQMYLEVTRGRSDIYDILTHLTFLYIESEKIRKSALDLKGRETLAWSKLREVVAEEEKGIEFHKEQAYTHLSKILGRTFEETREACEKFEHSKGYYSLFHIIYWMGNLSVQEVQEKKFREITFSSTLRERIGHHSYGEEWAGNIKRYLYNNDLVDRPLHIISANLHSFINTIYAPVVLSSALKDPSITGLAKKLSHSKNRHFQQKVFDYAVKNGLTELDDESGTNINVQIIDLSLVDLKKISEEISVDHKKLMEDKPLLLIMDYAFGEQAYETMDELLKPIKIDDRILPLNVQSISIMGKAGILAGNKGDIMVPSAHVFEGTADNYPIDNDFSSEDFNVNGIEVFKGTMISVLGTSLQNIDLLSYFQKSSWRAIGLEMEGAHYQKAIQSASKIRCSIKKDVKVRYAYYASDNPLETGNTLASGGLGEEGVISTYLITKRILDKIFG